MTIKVAINGFGRIGRMVLRSHYESMSDRGKKHDLQFVAVNDLGDAATNAHLLKYDTAHGKFPGTVTVEGDNMIVNGDSIRVFAQRNPAEIPWGELGVDVVLECTGFFTTKEKASAHLKGGAKKVIISAPGGKDVDATVVFGVNHGVLKATDTVISNGAERASRMAKRRTERESPEATSISSRGMGLLQAGNVSSAPSSPSAKKAVISPKNAILVPITAAPSTCCLTMVGLTMVPASTAVSTR